MSKHLRTFFIIIFLTIVSIIIALPAELPVRFNLFGREVNQTLRRPVLNFNLLGQQIHKDFVLKQGLDIQGGMQVVLRADMKDVPAEKRDQALEGARQVIQRRVDLYGVSEPVIQTSRQGEDYRLIVELAGIQEPDQALQLIGRTAQLDFRLMNAEPTPEATMSAVGFYSQFVPTGLTGKQLDSSIVQYDPKTNEPQVGLKFTPEGSKLFAEITKNNVGRVLAIFLDNGILSLPVIQTPILDGQAVISGDFTDQTAKELSIQLQAGSLPVPIEVIEQRTIGASLGQQSVYDSIRAGIIGLGCVIAFMIMYYGWKGFLASISLFMYAAFTIATYKLLGITLTLPGIAGLLLSIGMAVDSNILIFERMKEELRAGKAMASAMELGFGRAWDSIKDANIATICTAIILINPMDFSFLNTSGLVRGFGVTLLIGVLISLFTGMVVTRTLMRLFLKGE